MDVVSLADVKAHLRIPLTYTEDDYALMGFIYAADDVIRMECGDVVPKSYEEFHDGGMYHIYVHHAPILTVENVEEGWGWWDYELDFQPVNTVPASSMFAYSVDAPAIGRITRRSAGNVVIPFVPGDKNIKVNYTSGRQAIPGAVRLAALELIAHWYQASQLRSAQANAQSASYDAVEGALYTRAPESGLESINVGVPYRILELLKAYRRVPVIG